MSWDFRNLAPWVNWAEEGQGSEGGNNQYDNCVPAGTLLCLAMLYHSDKMEPQDVTSAVYGSAYHGVEDSAAVIGYCQGRSDLWPNFPGWSGDNPGDPAGWIEANGEAGKPMLYFVHCDSQARIVAGGPYGHCAVPIAGDGSSITLWANGFYGGVVTLSHADINAVDYGGAVLFDRTLTQGEHADMPKLISAGDTGEIFVTDGVFKRYIGNPGEANELQSVFGPITKLSQYTVDRFPTLAGDDEGHPSHAGNPDLSARGLTETLNAIKERVDQAQGGTGGGGLSAADRQTLADIKAALGRLEAAFKQA